MERAFDAYVVVDWSANSTRKTGADSIWWAAQAWEGSQLRLRHVSNPPTRAEAEAEIRRYLLEAVTAGRSVLIGFDFPYGCPAGFACALGLAGPAWEAVWTFVAEAIDDQQHLGRNNRFQLAGRLNRRLGAAQFWGHPPGRSYPGLGPTKPAKPPLPAYRLAERAARGAKSAWQLQGAGAVGSQALMGLPTLHRLRSDPALREVSTVWPFETGPLLPPRPHGRGRIVHAEVYPSLLAVEPVPGQVKDEAQVVSLAAWLARQDASHELGAYFAAPASLPPAERELVLLEEGWILGALP